MFVRLECGVAYRGAYPEQRVSTPAYAWSFGRLSAPQQTSLSVFEVLKLHSRWSKSHSLLLQIVEIRVLQQRRY
jgi:hypothetical protein